MPELTSGGEEELEKARQQENLKKIEAALFISGRWLSLQELIMLTDINPILIREMMDKLIEKYSIDTALQILSKEDKWKMDVKQEFSGMINKLATGSAEFCRAEQETLAVIAYKQPIKQSIVVRIRGNKAYDHIKKFVDLGLIKGRKLGRTKELTLSEEFHDYFKTSKPED
jgi:segregation and condensation protein B